MLNRPKSASAFAPSPANVTFFTYHNVYTYSPTKLWVAYGLAIFFTACSSIFGLFAVVANRASYSLTFSSVFRASRRAVMSVELKGRDIDIQDPLPSHLAKAKLSLGGPVHDQSHGDVPVLSEAVKAKSTGQSSSLLGNQAGSIDSRPRTTY